MDSNKDNASGSQVWHADTDPNANTGITCCEIEKEHRWCTYVPSQFGRITKQRRISGESLLMRSTETWSPTKRRNGTDQHQRKDLGIIYVFVNEGSGSSRKTLRRKSTYYQARSILCSINITRKLIQDQEHEIYGISTIEIQWMRSTLLHEDVVKLSTAKVYVFSDSVLCLGGRVAEYPQSVQSCKNRIELFSQNPQYRGLDNISGEQVVFEWEIFLRTHHAEVTPGSPKTWWRKKAFSR